MLAFVLSGGGNRGALEAGALIALAEREIRPDLLVGTSAGALNAAYFATNPTLSGALELAQEWRTVRRQDVFPGNWLTVAWRFVTGRDSLIDGRHLRRFIERRLPPGYRTFGDLAPRGVRLYVTSANLNTATLYLYGEDPSASLIDAVIASSALPATLPPFEAHGWQYVDGGVVANVPVSIAAAMGARTIYAVNVGYAGRTWENIRGAFPIVQRAIGVMMYQQLLNDLAVMSRRPEVELHHIILDGYQEAPIWDFSPVPEMIETGRRLTHRYLSHHRRQGQPLALGQRVEPAPPPPGARIWKVYGLPEG